MNKKVVNATKWSFLTEIIAKLISPITNMILARLLAPDMFGVITTVTMIISFADIFSDAGFQRYLVQHEFDNENKLFQSSNVAFTVNLFISICMWIVIGCFSIPLAKVLGNEGKGLVITIACTSLPLTSFSSIQMALFRRKFDFKKLFYVRLVGSLVPLFITVPLAYFIRNYWALVIGTICGNLTNAIVLTAMSEWKPKICFQFLILKEMLSFSLWTLCESIVTWLTSYIDVFIIGTFLSSYYIGIYKTSMTTINQIMALVTGATNTVLFSTLSRLQHDDKQFNSTFLRFQQMSSLLIIPMGVGIFAYREFVTQILLGSKWTEAINFIGIWGLVAGIYIVLGGYCSEVYRAKGKANISAIAQIVYIFIIVAVIEYCKNISFEAIYISRTLSRVLFIVIHFYIIHRVFKMSPLLMIKNILPAIVGSIIMYCIAVILKQIKSGIIWNLCSIVLCIVIYLGIIMIFPNIRRKITPYLKKLYEGRGEF